MLIYSFVVPIYKDGYLAEDFCNEFQRVFREYLNTVKIEDSVEVIFVDDGSNDNSAELLKNMCNNYLFVKVIFLSRNFGQHIALSCGYKYATGKYIGMLNVDMQDPPDQVPLLLEEIKKEKHDVIYGLYGERHVSKINKISSFMFNFLLNKLTGFTIPYNISTLRIMSRKFTDAYNSFTEKSRYLPGLEMWLGFSKGFVKINHQERKRGKSSYNFTKRMLFALESAVSFSDLPLKLAVIFGFTLSVSGFILTIFLIIQKLFFMDFKPGYTSSISLMIFIGGIQILFIGLASIYIGRILKEVQNRPLYVIKDKINLKD